MELFKLLFQDKVRTPISGIQNLRNSIDFYLLNRHSAAIPSYVIRPGCFRQAHGPEQSRRTQALSLRREPFDFDLAAEGLIAGYSFAYFKIDKA